MKIYNVLIETNDTDSSGEILFDISSFMKSESAKKFLKEKYEEYTSGMTEDEKDDSTSRSDGWIDFTVYEDEDCSDWAFRGTVIETEMSED